MEILMNILNPVLAISGMGLLFGLGLGYAGKILHVPEDEKMSAIRNVLPGANCGGCGFAGCEAFAEAVCSGAAKTDGCPVGGKSLNKAISSIMGVEEAEFIKKVAFIKCGGSLSKSGYKYNYQGLEDCFAAQALAGRGAKSCKFGCLGYGNCARVCNYGAISITGGIAVIDEKKCTQCGMCVASCPRNIIEIVPHSSVRVKCSSTDKGKDVKACCSVGCISCKLCEKACTYDAVHVSGNIAIIDYDKCNGCGACAEKCPAKVIETKIN